ncbi:MAG: type II toxin-antitoxin system ParD family antitoxin [Pseudanabaena sp. Salubria-1]|nr:type II toxin-antitoxin system ParD family antitoxin [Pseudanabaena sp. Salubria-1]
MPITLQPEQEQFIQTQLATGRYTNATEVIAEALQLLEKRNHYDRWVEELGNKIDIAAAELDRGEGLDGEIAINQLRARLHKKREA